MENKDCVDLDTTIEWLLGNSDKATLKEWSDENEESATVTVHHTVGRGLRNELGLWSVDEERTEIVKYFNSIGIYHGDDMSGIILSSFHRSLNKKDIKLDEQVARYRNYWASNNPAINKGIFK